MERPAPAVKSPVRSAAASPAAGRRIPYAFRADPVALDGLGLDPTARAVLVMILDDAKGRGWRSRLSNGFIGRALGRCPMSISRALGRLEAAGLVRRELAAGGRIRLAVVVTWEGVADARLTEQASVRRERPTGYAPASQGLGAGVEQTRSPVQSAVPDAARSPSPLGEAEDPAALACPGPVAAAYLRACVAAVNRGEPAPPPPAPAPSMRPVPAARTPRPDPVVATESAPGVTREVDLMVRSLAAAVRAPDAGRRWFPAAGDGNRAARRAEAAILRGRA